jgi:hypothetical protein
LNDDEVATLATELRFGPATWFRRCQEAVAAGPGAVAGLAAQLEPGTNVRRALDGRAHWPGGDHAGSGEGPGPALSAALALASVAGLIVGRPDSGPGLRAALRHWCRANVLSGQMVSGADISTGEADPDAGTALRRLAVLADDAVSGGGTAADDGAGGYRRRPLVWSSTAMA